MTLEIVHTERAHVRVDHKLFFLDLVLSAISGVSLASILMLCGCPVADSITAGLVLMIVLILIDMREGQVQ